VAPLRVVGRELAGFSVQVRREELYRFARAIGETRPQYCDAAAAQAIGYPDVLVPPTYLFSLELRRPDRYATLDELGAPLSSARHAGESISSERLCFAGDTLDFRLRITDYIEKRQGSLGLLERTTEVSRDGQLMATLVNVLAIRWDRAA
jgi:acyl dehydratase